MTTSNHDNAGRQPSEDGTAKCPKAKRITKLSRIINILMTRPEGLNCFEAAQFGDSCLHSTVAKIRDLYGPRLIQRWETVPSRFTDSGVRCLRFWLTGGA